MEITTFLRLLATLALLTVALGVLAQSAPPTATPEDCTLEQLELAIQEKGLSWTAKEYDRSFSLGLLPADEVPEVPSALQEDSSPADLPAALDWRASNGGSWVSSVKDQGRCGSCWAFAAVGVLESMLAINRGVPDTVGDLSEQILVSCAEDNFGCNGGYMHVTAEYLKTTGTYYENCYPYEAANGSCDQACVGWQKKAFKIGSYAPINRSATALKRALQDGPIQVGFAVYTDFFYYESGVYERVEGFLEGYHAVMCVGYMDVPGKYGGGYFIAKNSWDADWGEDGYFRIGYSQVEGITLFGIVSYEYEYELYTCILPVIFNRAR